MCLAAGGGGEHGTSALGDTSERQLTLRPQPIPAHTGSLPLSTLPAVHSSPLGLLYHPARLLSPPPFPRQGLAEARLGLSLDHLLLVPSLLPSQGLCFVMGNLL